MFINGSIFLFLLTYMQIKEILSHTFKDFGKYFQLYNGVFVLYAALIS